jgi:hypothetical protein
MPGRVLVGHERECVLREFWSWNRGRFPSEFASWI